MGRQVVLGLVVILALLAVAVAGVSGLRSFSRSGTPGGAPSLMIITRQQLLTTAQANTQTDADLLADIRADAVAREKTPNAKGGGAMAPSRAKQQASNFSVLVSTMEDALGGRVSDKFQNSGRFRLIPLARVIDAMDAVARDSGGPRGGFIQRAWGAIGGTGRSGASVTVQEEKDFSVGITRVARKVNAQYVLIVTMGEPNLVTDGFINPRLGDQLVKIVISGQPVLNAEIFDSRGRSAYRFSRQLDHPVVVSVDLNGDEPELGELRAALARANDRIAEAAASQVLAWALDKLAPARIVGTDGQLVVNRGLNDGVKVGAVYAVQREVGRDIHDSEAGADLGKLRTDVGALEIHSAQARLSTAVGVQGGPFKADDIVVVAGAAAGAPSGPGATPGALGGPVSLAVDHVRAHEGAKVEDSPDAANAVSQALASDSRVAILARADLEDLTSERKRNARAAGDFGLNGDEGLRQSGYLVSGDCRSIRQSHTLTVSIAGVSRPAGEATHTEARCTLRVDAVDGRLIGSVERAAATVPGAADAAARAVMAEILPKLGLPAVATAATPTETPAPAAAAPTTPRRRPHTRASAGPAEPAHGAVSF